MSNRTAKLVAAIFASILAGANFAAAAPPTNLVPPQANATVRKSIADAHAELPSPQARPDQGAGVDVQPGNSGAAATAGIQNSPPAAAPDAPAQPSIITSR